MFSEFFFHYQVSKCFCVPFVSLPPFLSGDKRRLGGETRSVKKARRRRGRGSPIARTKEPDRTAQPHGYFMTRAGRRVRRARDPDFSSSFEFCVPFVVFLGGLL